jgi:hypothetical protein
MNADQKLVTAAKRAAKTHARDHSIAYQKALDIIAARAGRSTWKAFLDDPVPVDDAATDAAAEPDFSMLPPDRHLETVLSHARATDAVAVAAGPRDAHDHRPTLRYLAKGADDGWRGVDARGMDLWAMARALAGSSARPVEGRIGYATRFETGAIVRAAIAYGHDGASTPSMTMSLNGHAAPEVHVHQPSPDGDDQNRSVAPRRAGRDRGALRRMIDRGPLSYNEGLLLGSSGMATARGLSVSWHGRPVRLRHGHGLLAVSPPGSGRLAMINIPMVVDDRNSSFVIHDDFGDMLTITSGWRASIGRVAVIRTDGPCPDAFNPLDAAWLHGGRECVERHVHDLMMIVSDDDMSIAQLMTEVAMELISDAGGTCLRDIHGQLRGRSDPLSGLAADALAPFVTDIMHAAFGRNTIVPADLRGRTTQGGRPLTIYLMRHRMAHRSDAMVALVQETIWRWMLSYGPGETLPGGETSGPCAFVSMLSDLHRMPRLRNLARTLDLQRAKRMSTIITSASGGAIAARYGAREATAIRQCCSIRYVTTQSDPGDVEFIDPEGRLGYPNLSALDARRGVLMSAHDDAGFRQVPFFSDPHLLQRSFNPRTLKGPKPVA